VEVTVASLALSVLRFEVHFSGLECIPELQFLGLTEVHEISEEVANDGF
jgi:hypothetical protein